MSEADRIEAAPLIDPDVMPVRVVNGIANLTYIGSLFDLTLTTTMAGIDTDNNLQVQRAIAARLRFDLDFARTLHAGLGEMIEALTVPPKDKVN